MVCKRNPYCIIKWQCSGSSSARSTSVASSRGSAPSVSAPRGKVQMMAGPPAPYTSCPRYYYPPLGYYCPPPQLPTPRQNMLLVSFRDFNRYSIKFGLSDQEEEIRTLECKINISFSYRFVLFRLFPIP